MRNYGVVPSRGGWRARPRVRRWHLLQPLGLVLVEAALPEVRLRSQREFGAAGSSAEAAAAPQGSRALARAWWSRCLCPGHLCRKAVGRVLLRPPLTPQSKKYYQVHGGMETRKLKLNLRTMHST